MCLNEFVCKHCARFGSSTRFILLERENMSEKYQCKVNSDNQLKGSTDENGFGKMEEDIVDTWDFYSNRSKGQDKDFKENRRDFFRNIELKRELMEEVKCVVNLGDQCTEVKNDEHGLFEFRAIDIRRTELEFSHLLGRE